MMEFGEQYSKKGSLGLGRKREREKDMLTRGGVLMDFCNKPKTLVISLNIFSQIYIHTLFSTIFVKKRFSSDDNIVVLSCIPVTVYRP